eukprot:14774382-Alexandrium_andersonii.AAC.1
MAGRYHARPLVGGAGAVCTSCLSESGTKAEGARGRWDGGGATKGPPGPSALLWVGASALALMAAGRCHGGVGANV